MGFLKERAARFKDSREMFGDGWDKEYRLRQLGTTTGIVLGILSSCMKNHNVEYRVWDHCPTTTADKLAFFRAAEIIGVLGLDGFILNKSMLTIRYAPFDVKFY